MTTTDGPIANIAFTGDAAKQPVSLPAREGPPRATRPEDRLPGDRTGRRVAIAEAPPSPGINGTARSTIDQPSPSATETPTATVITTHDLAANPTLHPTGIIAAALKPEIDPCDVACEAMPAHVIGDLTPPEDAWLLAHTGECNYCRNVLQRYHRVDEILERLQHYLDPVPTPPPFRPPVAQRTARPRRLTDAAPVPRPRPVASYGTIESPVGPLWVAVSEAGVCEIGFAVNETEEAFRAHLHERGFAPEPCLEHDLGPETVARVTRQLEEYFSGRRDHFDIPLDFAGISPFTRSVLTATVDVPFGHLATYRDIAAKIGAPSATRAVGNALGRNPIPVIVPCHRIVRSDATLGGYTGGLGIKKRLLAIEGIVPQNLGLR